MSLTKRVSAIAVAVVLAGVALAWWLGNGPKPAVAEPTASSLPRQNATTLPARGKTFKILHIMSYDSAWGEWTLGQLNAFKAAMAGVPVEYRVVELDVRRNTTDESKKRVTAEAKAAIDEWKPDLVYTTDDFAQSAVVKDYLDTDLPFVFSGVNAEPEKYGFDKAKNVTGVLEREHLAQSMKLLTTLGPSIRRIAVLSDRAETWPAVIRRIREIQSQLEVQIVAIDQVDTLAEYQSAARGYVGRADAILTLGIYGLKNDAGESVSLELVMKWLHDEIPLPNTSFWANRVPQGLLCAVVVSPEAQGSAAGQMARSILVDGKRPCDIPIITTQRGQPIVNLAAANELGIKIPSSVLLSSKVVSKFDWQR